MISSQFMNSMASGIVPVVACWPPVDAGTVENASRKRWSVARPPTRTATLSSSVAVHARDLTARHGQHVALDEVDLDLPTGKRTVIIGPNGSGKSTLLRVISGLHTPARGTVEVFGRSPSSQRRRMAHVLQASVINESMPISVVEAVRMGTYGRLGLLRRSDTASQAVDRAMARLEIQDLADRHLTELSGGQRQRVMVAQGVVQGADLLLLDEPLSGLDLTSIERIDAIVDDELADGRTVVVTTHDLRTALRADHVVLLATRIVATGDPAEVLTEANLARAYGGHVHELPGGARLLGDPAPH